MCTIIIIKYISLGYSNTIDSQNDQAQLQILDEVNLQVVEQEQAIRQLEVSTYIILYYNHHCCSVKLMFII